MFPSLLINLGEGTFPMLLAETARLYGGPIFEFEIEGFLPVFCLRTEKIVARCEERLPVMRLQSFSILLDRLPERMFVLETMVYL